MTTNARTIVPCTLCAKLHEPETLLEPKPICPSCLDAGSAEEVVLELVTEAPARHPVGVHRVAPRGSVATPAARVQARGR